MLERFNKRRYWDGQTQDADDVPESDVKSGETPIAAVAKSIAGA
jgi:hypothetical protein